MTILEYDPESGCSECRFHCVALEECWADLSRTVATSIEPPASSGCPLRSGPVVVFAPKEGHKVVCYETRIWTGPDDWDYGDDIPDGWHCRECYIRPRREGTCLCGYCGS